MIYVTIIIRYKLICNAYAHELRLLQAVIYNIYIIKLKQLINKDGQFQV